MRLILGKILCVFILANCKPIARQEEPTSELKLRVLNRLAQYQQRQNARLAKLAEAAAELKRLTTGIPAAMSDTMTESVVVGLVSPTSKLGDLTITLAKGMSESRNYTSMSNYLKNINQHSQHVIKHYESITPEVMMQHYTKHKKDFIKNNVNTSVDLEPLEIELKIIENGVTSNYRKWAKTLGSEMQNSLSIFFNQDKVMATLTKKQRDSLMKNLIQITERLQVNPVP